MKQDNSKQRLIEVMQRLDKTFKSNLTEDINIDVEVGDTVMTGKFKNKKTVIKTIGEDEHGMPTINGKKAVTFRKSVDESIHNTAMMGGILNSKGIGGYNPDTKKQDDEYAAMVRGKETNPEPEKDVIKEGGNTDGASVGHNIYKEVMALINNQVSDEVWAGGAENALMFYDKVVDGLRDALYQDMGDSVNPNAGAAPDEMVEADAFNDAGEPNMTHSQFRDHSEPAEPDYDQDRDQPQQKSGVGEFRDIDWKTLHGIFVQNTEAFKQGKIGDGVTINDLTDYDGYLSPDELQHLDDHSLVYVDGQFVVIDDDQYLDFNTFLTKAQEIWGTEADIHNSNGNDSEAPYMRGYEPMSENVIEKRLMQMMTAINPIKKII